MRKICRGQAFRATAAARQRRVAARSFAAIASAANARRSKDKVGTVHGRLLVRVHLHVHFSMYLCTCAHRILFFWRVSVAHPVTQPLHSPVSAPKRVWRWGRLFVGICDVSKHGCSSNGYGYSQREKGRRRERGRDPPPPPWAQLQHRQIIMCQEKRRGVELEEEERRRRSGTRRRA